MQTSRLSQFILNHKQRLGMPIGVYAGLEMTGASVRTAVTDASAQSDAVLALQSVLGTHFLLTAMDLSAEAEEFDCEIRMVEDEIPTVVGRLVSNAAEIEALMVPHVGKKRTRVHLECAERLLRHTRCTPVLGGMIGPFSLAGRLFGVSQILEMTIVEPEAIHVLLEKATRFLIDYALAFRGIGAWGVIMAEPAAGLLSPRALAAFSSAYIRRIVEAAQTQDFSILYHNCGAKNAHLTKIFESGADQYHFGALMDMPAALEQVSGNHILSGNLDPTAIFHQAKPEEVRFACNDLLGKTAPYPNFVLSSGCDIPPGTPLENMRAFVDSLEGFNEREGAVEVS